MSGQPETAIHYPAEKLSQARYAILKGCDLLLVSQARVEKYRTANLERAREAHGELQRVRKHLVAALGDARLAFLEMEEYSAAQTAAKLQTGLAGFNLMSNVYKPVYKALTGFAQKLPESVTTNLLDPCCGCSKALCQMAQGNNYFAYGMELDESRAEEAQTRLHRVGMGSFFHSRISSEAFHAMLLNPPYLSVLNENGGRTRHEKRFLIESIGHLMYGGLLIYIIPYYWLTADVCRILSDNFSDLSVWRFTDGEFKKFKQAAVLGLRKRREGNPECAQALERYSISPANIPCVMELEEGRYTLPSAPKSVDVFKGEKFNEKDLEQQLCHSDSFQKLMAKSELDSADKRPLLPLSIGQIGLVGGSSMINGLIECDTPRIIKGRIIKVRRVETEDKVSASGRHMGQEIREVISNKMVFNVLTPQGFLALA